MQYSTHLLCHFRRLIGRNIYRFHMQQKLTLTKLARLSGVSMVLLDHYEMGKNEIRLDHMLKIACALRIDATNLLHE